MAVFAQVQEAVDIAGRAERLGLIGVLALLVLVLGWVLWRLFNQAIASRDATITRLLGERNQALEDNARLRGMYDRVIVLAASASKQAADEVRRLTDGRQS